MWHLHSCRARWWWWAWALSRRWSCSRASCLWRTTAAFTWMAACARAYGSFYRAGALLLPFSHLFMQVLLLSFFAICSLHWQWQIICMRFS